MTKQEFLNGKSFRSKTSLETGSCSYKYKVGKDTQMGFIEKEIRHGKTDQVVLSDHHLNVSEITNNIFSGYTFVMEEEINVEYSFEDFVVIEDYINDNTVDNLEQITVVG